MSSIANSGIASPDTAAIGTALASIFAFYFNMPCIMALSSAVHETHSLKWPLRIALYYIGVSLVLAGIVYHLALLIW